jgi:hypothetical protein
MLALYHLAVGSDARRRRIRTILSVNCPHSVLIHAFITRPEPSGDEVHENENRPPMGRAVLSTTVATGFAPVVCS